MAITFSTASELGSKAPPFSLIGVDGKQYSLNTFKDARGLLVVFMCNHCPYVVAVHGRISRLAREFASQGIAVIGINSNDPSVRIADSFENMKIIAKEWDLPFPYVFDESQTVAKAYDAVCTPDPYLYEKVGADFTLRYRGRVDDSWKDESLIQKPDLRNAMVAICEGKNVDSKQVASMGCGIKWKN
jgi:peroxiredoxin